MGLHLPGNRKKKRHLTFKGRVVYDRKPHLFTIRDLTRISKQLQYPKDYFEAVEYCASLVMINLAIINLVRDRFDVFEFALQVRSILTQILWKFLDQLRAGGVSDVLVALGIIGKEAPEVYIPLPPRVEYTGPKTLGDLPYWKDGATGKVWVPYGTSPALPPDIFLS